jgi:hypothetical protein
MGSARKTEGVSILISRRVVPTGHLASRGQADALFQASLTPDMLDALPQRDVSQLLQQSEVTQRR